MVAVVAGAGLGLERSSVKVLGRAGQLGTAVLGQAGEGVFVNAATGNLIVQDTDEMLFGMGPDAALSRTFNSKASGTNRWQQSTSRKVSNLTGTLNTAGSTVRHTSWDGSDITYSWDATVSGYVAREGEGGYDVLRLSGSTWTWTDGATRTTEEYDNANGGRITKSIDADLNALTFTYDAAGLLAQVTTQNGESTQFQYTNGNLTSCRTVYTDGGVQKTLTRVKYGYDASNRLTLVTVDLSPEDGSTADGKVYTTTYEYNTSNLISRITQSDGSYVSFTWASGRVAQVDVNAGDGITRTTKFTYDTTALVTTITDPYNQVTKFAYDSQSRLVGLTSANGDVTGFNYNGKGDVTTVTAPDGSVVTYTYDANGNRLKEVDGAGDTVVRTYGAKNEVLTETRYVVAAQGAAAASDPATTRYAYDSENHLRFVIGAEGEVTEYRYNAAGLQTAAIQYTQNLYTNSGSTEQDLASWVQNIADKSGSNRVDTAYDFRGKVSVVSSYGRVLADGSGDTTQDVSKTHYIYDQAGRLLSRRPDTVASGQSYVYDGLGRTIASTDSAGQTTTFVFSETGASSKLVVTLSNGLVQTSMYNRVGELISFNTAGSDGGAASTSTYQYDLAGRLRIVTDSQGNATHSLYDPAGRQIGTVGPDRSLTEYRYNSRDQLIATTRYAYKLTSSQMASLVDGAGSPANVAIASLRPAADPADRWEWRVYDKADRLAQTIDAAGATTVYQYDGRSQLISVVRYARRFDAATVAGFKSTPPTSVIIPGAGNSLPSGSAQSGAAAGSQQLAASPMFSAAAAEEPQGPTLSIGPATLTQSEGQAGSTWYVFTVTRSGDLSGPTTADWAVSGSGA
ncbi:MAG TPA: hypothetical protein VIO94_11320, partial [Phenylobacterium sp.]